MAASTATEITNFLSQASKNSDVASLERAYRLLQQLQIESSLPSANNATAVSHVNPDLYLFCCEAAIGLNRWEMAKQCIIPALHAGTSTKANEVRSIYCRALIEASESKLLRCDALVQRLVDALTKVVQGIRTALQDPAKLSQLVIIGTQHLWNICQPLFREGTFHTIVSCVGFAVYCLEAIECGDVASRSQWMIRYAVALNGAGRYSEASAYMSKAMDFIAKFFPQLRHTAFKVQVALTKQAPNPRVKESASKGIARHIYTAQSFLAGITDSSTALEEVLSSFEEMSIEFAARDGKDVKPNVESPAKTGKKSSTPRGKKGEKPQQLTEAEKSEEMVLFDETLGDIGLCLALLDQVSKAKQCATLLATSRSLQARVYSEYIAAWVAVSECGGFAVQQSLHLESLTASVEATLIDTVRNLERSLQSAIRIADTHQRTHVVQHGVILLWNVALPLLQTRQRTQISRSLQVAAKLLDGVQSNLNELRTLLHYESALTDVDSDYLGKATSRLDKALGIDYRVAPSESRLYGMDRPWDRFLGWIRRSLEMRNNLYQTPDNPLDEALLIVEQSKEASIANRVSMLTKAENILTKSEPSEDFAEDHEPVTNVIGDASAQPASPTRGGKSTPTGKKRPTLIERIDAAPRDVELEKRREHLQHRAQLWHLILSYGWRDGSPLAIPVCRIAANALLARSWPRKGDRDMLILQADAHLRLAEMRMAELSRQSLHIAQLSVSDACENGAGDSAPGAKHRSQNNNAESAIADRMRAVSEATSTVQAHIVAVTEIAVCLIKNGYPDQWLLLNAAIFLWNSFLPSFNENNFMGALDSLQVVVPALTDPENKIDPQTETQIYQDLMLAYVKCLIQLFVIRKLAGPTGTPSTATVAEAVAITSFHDFSATDPTSTFLSKAWDVCDKAVQLLRTPMDAKEFLMLTSTIRRFQGRAMDTHSRLHPQEKLLIIIDQLFHPNVTSEDRSSLVKFGLELLSQDPNVELCARFAEKAMGSHNKVAARAAIIGKNLFDNNKLGLKQNELLLAIRRQPAAAAKKEGKEESKSRDKKKSVLEIAEPVETVPVVIPDPSGEDYQWYALLLMYKGCVTASLLNPSVQDKTTQIEIRRQALVAIAESVTSALKGSSVFASRHIMECYRHFRNIAQELAGDSVSRHFAFESLRVVLCDAALRLCAPFSTVKSSAHRLSDAEVVAQLLLLMLKVLCDHKRAEEGMAVMKTAISILPTSQHKPFWALDIQLRCEAGLSTAQTLMRVKEFSAEMQAQTYLALARHGKDKMDQLYAYQKAIELMQVKPVERAELMLSMAQWALEANAPLGLNDVRAMILSAIDLANTEAEASTQTNSNLSKVMSAVDSVLSGKASNRGPSRSGDGGPSARRPSGASGQKPTVRQLFVAIQGYYLLSKIASHAPDTVDGVLVDRRTCSHMIVHYVMAVWQTMADSSNSHNREAKAKWAAQEARAAQLSKQQQAEALALRDEAQLPPPDSPQPVSTGKMDKKAKAAASAAAAAAAAQAQAQAQTLAMVSTLTRSEQPNFPDDIVIPSTPHAWIGYSFPSALLNTARALTSPYSLNRNTVENPDAIVALLRDTVDLLVHEGVELQTPPLTAMIVLMLHTFYPADTDSRVQAVESESLVKAWDVCYRAGATAAAEPYSIANPIPPAEERAALAEDSALVQKHRQGLTAAKSSNSTSIVVVRQPNRSQQPIHHFWLSVATLLLKEGRIGQVQELIAEALRHAKAHGDRAALARGAFLEGYLAFIDGRFTDSLSFLSNAVTCDSIDHSLLVDVALLKANNYLAQNNLDMAFAAEAEVQQALGSQMNTLQGLSREVAQCLIPDVQGDAAIRFAELLITHLDKQQGITLAIPPKTRQAGCTEIITTIDEAIAGLRTVISRAWGHTADSPHLRHRALLLEIEADRRELAAHPEQYTHKELKKRLQSQGAMLEEAIASLKREIAPGNEAVESVGITAHSSAQKELSRLLVAHGLNICQRVVLNNVLIDDLRSSTFTRIEVPRMEGAPEALHKEVVKFMRSTAKMREATRRRKQREAVREKIEEQRVALRAEKQRDIDRLREQRRAEEAAAATAVVQTKRDTKGRTDKKTSTRRKSDVEATVELIADVDPNDKCGLDSPRTSDDEGIDEDSQSDEEEELESALQGLDNVSTEARLSFANAFTLFSEASELVGGSAHTMMAPQKDPQYFLACALRRIAENEIVALDQRSAVVSGRDLPSLLKSPTVLRCWSLPIDFTRKTEVDERPVSLQRGKDEKLSSKSGKTSATPKEAPQVTALPIPEVRAVTTQSDLPRIPFPPAPAIAAAQQALPMLFSCASRAHALGNRKQLASIMMEIANVAAMQHNAALAGQAIEMSQAAAASEYILSMWKEIGPRDTPEAALVRLVDHIAETSPHLRSTQQYLGMLGLIQHYSPMHTRLALPNPSFLCGVTPEQPVTTPRGNRGPMPNDSLFLTITCEMTDYLSTTRLLAVLRRPCNQVDTRMIFVSTSALDELVLRSQKIANSRHKDLQTGRLSESESDFVAYVEEVSAMFDQLLSPFAPLFQPTAGRVNVTIASHPHLYPLPLESIATLAKCATVSRDISIFTFQQRLLRRTADRYLPINVQCMVDPFAENNDNSIRFVFCGEMQPRSPNFTNTTTTVDINQQVRPVQTHQALKLFTQPSANSVLIDCGGRFSSICPIGELSGLQLEHIRAAFVFDRAVSSKSTRRENESSMEKPLNVLRHESTFWVTPLLMLARGVDYVVINSLPTSVPFADCLTQCSYLALEKPCNFTDALSAFVPRYSCSNSRTIPPASIPQLSDQPNAVLPQPQDAVALPPIPQQKPSSRPGSTAAKVGKDSTTIPIPTCVMDTASLKFFGLQPFDELAPLPQTKTK